jgi:hypothetical protein
MNTVVKKCCGLCPLSRKATLYLHPERAEEFAYSADNPYNDFICHKTGVDNGDENESAIVRVEKSLTCAGFHAMQSEINGSESKIGFDIEEHFTDSYEMICHHEDEHYKTNSHESI